jgi:CRISPR-associated protein Cas1
MFRVLARADLVFLAVRFLGRVAKEAKNVALYGTAIMILQPLSVFLVFQLIDKNALTAVTSNVPQSTMLFFILEGRVARRYWQAFCSVIPECFDFRGRMTLSHQNNVSDPVNLALNYAYAVLEGECRRAINAVGLESSVGFLHDFANYQTKQSLVYDLQEPFRWIADLGVVEAFESGALDLPHFYFTGDDYRYRLETEAKQRFLDLLKQRFNAGTTYNGRTLKWDTVIEQKAVELGRYLVGKSTKLSFSDPSPRLARIDDRELRERILKLSQLEASRLGIQKSTRHYLRKRAGGQEPFRVYKHVLERLGK